MEGKMRYNKMFYNKIILKVYSGIPEGDPPVYGDYNIRSTEQSRLHDRKEKTDYMVIL